MSKLTRVRHEAVLLGKLVAVVLLFRAFVAQAYVIPSGSMTPTLAIGDHIFVDRLTYRLHAPHAGDIVVFDHPQKHGTDLVKRVVAVSGDHIEGHDGQVWVNGEARGASYDFAAAEVPPTSLFVMGDNRGNSSDSRVWGYVPEGLVAGRAFVVWWNGAQPTRSFTLLR